MQSIFAQLGEDCVSELSTSTFTRRSPTMATAARNPRLVSVCFDLHTERENHADQQRSQRPVDRRVGMGALLAGNKWADASSAVWGLSGGGRHQSETDVIFASSSALIPALPSVLNLKQLPLPLPFLCLVANRMSVSLTHIDTCARSCGVGRERETERQRQRERQRDRDRDRDRQTDRQRI